MAINPRDFEIRGVVPAPIVISNDAKIFALSDREFAELYLALMREYRFWDGGQSPLCSKCNLPVEKPQDLRRYFGRCLHPSCFAEVYAKERRRIKGSERKYFDRVAKVDLSSLV